MTKKKSSETSGVVENPENLPSNLFDINKIDIKVRNEYVSALIMSMLELYQYI